MRITRRIVEEAKRFGLEVNQQKTSYVIMGDTQGETGLYITLQMQDGQEHRFKIEESGKEEQEIKARLTKGSRKYGMLRPFMRSVFVSRKPKDGIYKTVLRATV